MPSIQIVDSLPYDQWIKFVDEHPDGNIFHTPFMMEVFKKTSKHQPTFFAAIDERDREILSLVLSVQIGVPGTPTSRLTSRSVIYGGVLCAGTVDGGNSLTPLMNSYNTSVKERVLFTEIRNMSSPAQSGDKL